MNFKLLNPQITVEDVINLQNLFTREQIEIWIDGGWGVDALLGHQTRPHNDLDIALKHSNVPMLRKLFETRGYRNVPRNDTRDCNFVLGDDKGHLIDVHSFELGASGNNVFGVPYIAKHLTGNGIIAGQQVKCISAEWIVKSLRDSNPCYYRESLINGCFDVP
jgi:lincosamide nucleotidyltransferase A/C/D/E